jgi:hypothetical protein
VFTANSQAVVALSGAGLINSRVAVGTLTYTFPSVTLPYNTRLNFTATSLSSTTSCVTVINVTLPAACNNLLSLLAMLPTINFANYTSKVAFIRAVFNEAGSTNSRAMPPVYVELVVQLLEGIILNRPSLVLPGEVGRGKM